MRREANHLVQRQPKSQTDGAKSAESRSPPASEEVAESPFVDPGMPAEVAPGPTAQDARPIDRRDVNRPRRRRSHLISSANDMDDAIEGTVYRLEKQWKARCYAFRAFRPSGDVAFRAPLLGAPTAANGPHPRVRLRPPSCGFRLATDALGSAQTPPRIDRAARCALEFVRRHTRGRRYSRDVAAGEHRH
jgi:hypothetical protein